MHSSTYPQSRCSIQQSTEPWKTKNTNGKVMAQKSDPKLEQEWCSRFSSKYFGVRKVGNGWTASLGGRTLGSFASEYEAADHVDFELDMLNVDANLRNRSECMETLKKMKVTNGRDPWRKWLKLFKDEQKTPPGGGKIIPDFENTLCAKYLIPHDKLQLTCSKSCNIQVGANSPTKHVDEPSTAMQLLEAKINPATLLSLDEVSSSIPPPLGSAHRKTVGLSFQLKNIDCTPTSDTQDPGNSLATPVSSNKKIVGKQVLPKIKGKFSGNFVKNNGVVDNKSQPKEKLKHSDDISKRGHKLLDDANIESITVSDGVKKRKRKQSDDPKNEITTWKQAKRNKRKRKQIGITSKMKPKVCLEGNDLPSKTISMVKPGNPLKLKVQIKSKQTVEPVADKKLEQIDCTNPKIKTKPERDVKRSKEKRKRRKKSPNSPYKIGSSRYYGVCRHKYGVNKKWVAKCGSKYIGYFKSEEEAAMAVDKKLDEMGIDIRFRNRGGGVKALRIMKKFTGKPCKWRRSASIKHKLGEYEDLSTNVNDIRICNTAKETIAPRNFDATQNYDEDHQNLINYFETPLEFSNMLQIEPELPKCPKLEFWSSENSDFDINTPIVPITAVAVQSNSEDNARSIASADFERYDTEMQQKFPEIPNNYQSQLMVSQSASHMVNPVRMMVNPVRTLLLWKSQGLLSVLEYVMALRMLDGRYGEVNVWSTKGLLDMGDLDTLKATLK